MAAKSRETPSGSQRRGALIRDEITHLRLSAQQLAAAVDELADRLSSPAVDVDLGRKVLAIIAARRSRERIFPDHWFSDPAWDILLSLFAHALAGHKPSLSAVCVDAACPPTTALRWLSKLIDEGAVVREADPADPRRALLSLSLDTHDALRRYLVELEPVDAIGA